MVGFPKSSHIYQCPKSNVLSCIAAENIAIQQYFNILLHLYYVHWLLWLYNTKLHFMFGYIVELSFSYGLVLQLCMISLGYDYCTVYIIRVYLLYSVSRDLTLQNARLHLEPFSIVLPSPSLLYLIHSLHLTVPLIQCPPSSSLPCGFSPSSPNGINALIGSL